MEELGKGLSQNKNILKMKTQIRSFQLQLSYEISNQQASCHLQVKLIKTTSGQLVIIRSTQGAHRGLVLHACLWTHEE